LYWVSIRNTRIRPTKDVACAGELCGLSGRKPGGLEGLVHAQGPGDSTRELSRCRGVRGADRLAHHDFPAIDDDEVDPARAQISVGGCDVGPGNQAYRGPDALAGGDDSHPQRRRKSTDNADLLGM
jgi:hypothetical protein